MRRGSSRDTMKCRHNWRSSHSLCHALAEHHAVRDLKGRGQARSFRSRSPGSIGRAGSGGVWPRAGPAGALRFAGTPAEANFFDSTSPRRSFAGACANLEGACFDGDLEGADLADADLYWASFHGQSAAKTISRPASRRRDLEELIGASCGTPTWVATILAAQRNCRAAA